MTENKFSRTRSTPNKPYICKSKKPIPPPPPYHPYPLTPGGPFNPIARALIEHRLPPVPERPFEKITTRNLIYHVYPRKDDTTWIDNLRQLIWRWPIFNGRRIIAVAQGPDLWSVEHVACRLPNTARILPVDNSPRLREAASFALLLNTVKNASGNQATFYGHTKGTDQNRPENSPHNEAIRAWRNTMYQQLLGFPKKLAAAFEFFAAVGCFKIDYSHIPGYEMISPTGGRLGNWHFAGAFYWFRHDHVFRNPYWTNIPEDPFAAEMWIGHVIESHLAHSVYQHHPPQSHPHPDLYNIATHQKVAKGYQES